MGELLKELRESRDKMVQQDQSTKASVHQLQRDMAQRLEQVQEPGGRFTLGLHRDTPRQASEGRGSVLSQYSGSQPCAPGQLLCSLCAPVEHTVTRSASPQSEPGFKQNVFLF